MPPPTIDAGTLTPDEALFLCRFCLVPQMKHHLHTTASWLDSEIGILYNKLTGEQLLPTTMSAGWCFGCARRMHDAAEMLQLLRDANAFWLSYMRLRSVDRGSPVDDHQMPIKIEIECLSPGPYDTDVCNGSTHTECSTENDPVGLTGKTGKTPNRLTCDICADTFDSMPMLRRHFRHKHGSTERYTCTQCDAAPMTPSEWRRHQPRHLPKDQYQFECDRCRKRYPSAKGLRAHVRHVHERLDDTGAVCDQCGISYPSPRSLRAHVANVHDQVAVTCAVCHKTLRNQMKLRDHMIRHRPKSLRCPEAPCASMFRVKKELSEHVRMVHRKERKFLCTECGTGFLINFQLKQHRALGRCPAMATRGVGGGSGEMSGLCSSYMYRK